MLFLQPLTFITDMVGHIVSIVLLGFVITECVACYADLKAYHEGRMDERGGNIFRVRSRDCLLLLASVIIFTLWIIVDYFVGSDSALYLLSFHWISIFAVLFLLSRLSYWRETRRLTLLYGALVITALAHIALDIPHMFWQTLPYDRLLRATLKILETLSLYFFVVLYAILSQTSAYADNAAHGRAWTRMDARRLCAMGRWCPSGPCCPGAHL